MFIHILVHAGEKVGMGVGIQCVVTEETGNICQTYFLILCFENDSIFQQIVKKSPRIFFVKNIADIVFSLPHIRIQIVKEDVRALKTQAICVLVFLDDFFQVVRRQRLVRTFTE